MTVGLKARERNFRRDYPYLRLVDTEGRLWIEVSVHVWLEERENNKNIRLQNHK